MEKFSNPVRTNLVVTKRELKEKRKIGGGVDVESWNGRSERDGDKKTRRDGSTNRRKER